MTWFKNLSKKTKQMLKLKKHQLSAKKKSWDKRKLRHLRSKLIKLEKKIRKMKMMKIRKLLLMILGSFFSKVHMKILTSNQMSFSWNQWFQWTYANLSSQMSSLWLLNNFINKLRTLLRRDTNTQHYQKPLSNSHFSKDHQIKCQLSEIFAFAWV